MGFLSQLLALLSAAAGAAREQAPGDQPCHNLMAALQVLTALVMPPGPWAAGGAGGQQGAQGQCMHNKDALAQQGGLELLLGLALGSAACPDGGVRAQVRGWPSGQCRVAERCAGSLGEEDGGDRPARHGTSSVCALPKRACPQVLCCVPRSQRPPDPGLPQALACLAGLAGTGPPGSGQPRVQLPDATVAHLTWTALHTGDEAEQAAADAVVEAVYAGNPVAQTAAAFALFSRGEPELVQALASGDAQASSRAASLLGHMVRGCADAQHHLAQQLQQQLTHCTRQLGALLLAPQPGGPHGMPPVAVLRLLRLMLSWLPGCAPATITFLQAASAAPFLVGVVSGAQPTPPAVRGLMAVLLGACALARRAAVDAPPGVPSAAVLQEVIDKQIGGEVFGGLLSGVRQLAVAGGSGSAGMQPSYVPWGALVSLSFYDYVTALAADVSRGLAGGAVPALVGGPLAGGMAAGQVPAAQLAPPPAVQQYPQQQQHPHPPAQQHQHQHPPAQQHHHPPPTLQPSPTLQPAPAAPPPAGLGRPPPLMAAPPSFGARPPPTFGVPLPPFAGHPPPLPSGPSSSGGYSQLSAPPQFVPPRWADLGRPTIAQLVCH